MVIDVVCGSCEAADDDRGGPDGCCSSAWSSRWSLFMIFVAQTALNASAWAITGRLTLARIVGGGIISPAALTVLPCRALSTPRSSPASGVSRSIGFGYSAPRKPAHAAFGLFTGERDAAGGRNETGQARWTAGHARRRTCRRSIRLRSLPDSAGRGHQHHGASPRSRDRQFSWFVTAGTLDRARARPAAAGPGSGAVEHRTDSPEAARPDADREAPAGRSRRMVPWNISLVPPRLTELMPVAPHGRQRDTRLSQPCLRRTIWGRSVREVRRDLGDTRGLPSSDEVRVGVRRGRPRIGSSRCSSNRRTSALSKMR